MDPVLLARLQFFITVAFHFIFPAVTIGLGLVVAIATLASRAAAPHLWDNFGSPIAWVAPIAVALALAGVAVAVARGAASLAFVASSIGVAALVGILGIGLYPRLLPDANGGIGLTASNASSSDLTLTVMLVIAVIGVPLVLAYTAWIYRHFWGPVETDREGGY